MEKFYLVTPLLAVTRLCDDDMEHVTNWIEELFKIFNGKVSSQTDDLLILADNTWRI